MEPADWICCRSLHEAEEQRKREESIMEKGKDVVTYMDYIAEVVQEDLDAIREKEKGYKGSWKKRGGIGAYMNVARKIDRMEIQAELYGWDIFKAIEEDQRPEGILDDVQDLRRYLILIEAEMKLRLEPPMAYKEHDTHDRRGEKGVSDAER